MNIKALTSAALAGLLRPMLQRRQRGLGAGRRQGARHRDRGDRRARRRGDYESLITRDGDDRAAGRARSPARVFADGKPRIVDIKGIRMDAEFGPSMIYVTNEDKPGFIGRFACLLGEAGINIATFHLGRDAPGGDAIALVEIDGDVAGRRCSRRAGAAAGPAGQAAAVLNRPRAAIRKIQTFPRFVSRERSSDRPVAAPGRGARASSSPVVEPSSRAYKIPDGAGFLFKRQGERRHEVWRDRLTDRHVTFDRDKVATSRAAVAAVLKEAGRPPDKPARVQRRARPAASRPKTARPARRTAKRKTAKAKTPAGSRAAVNAKRARSARGGERVGRALIVPRTVCAPKFT